MNKLQITEQMLVEMEQLAKRTVLPTSNLPYTRVQQIITLNALASVLASYGIEPNFSIKKYLNIDESSTDEHDADDFRPRS